MYQVERGWTAQQETRSVVCIGEFGRQSRGPRTSSRASRSARDPCSLLNLKTRLSTEDKTGEVGRTAVEQEAGAAGSQAKGFGFFGAVETKPLQKCRRADRKLGLVRGARERQKGAAGTVAKRRGPPCSLTCGHCRLRELAREIPLRLVCAISRVSNVGGWFPMSRTLDGARQTRRLA